MCNLSGKPVDQIKVVENFTWMDCKFSKKANGKVKKECSSNVHGEIPKTYEEIVSHQRRLIDFFKIHALDLKIALRMNGACGRDLKTMLSRLPKSYGNQTISQLRVASNNKSNFYEIMIFDYENDGQIDGIQVRLFNVDKIGNYPVAENIGENIYVGGSPDFQKMLTELVLTMLQP